MGPSSFSAISFSSSIAWTSGRPQEAQGFACSEADPGQSCSPACLNQGLRSSSLSCPALCACCSFTPPGRLSSCCPSCMCMYMRQFSQRCLCDIFPSSSFLGLMGEMWLSLISSVKTVLLWLYLCSRVHIISTCKKNVLHYSIAKPNLKLKHTEDKIKMAVYKHKE